jgi:hypothetical protein
VRNAHHTIVKWMFYKHSGLSLGYVLCAFPTFALVGGDEEIVIDYIMVGDVLEGSKVEVCGG